MFGNANGITRRCGSQHLTRTLRNFRKGKNKAEALVRPRHINPLGFAICTNYTRSELGVDQPG